MLVWAFFGISSLVTVVWLYHSERARYRVHCLPYVFLLFAIVSMAVFTGSVDWLASGIVALIVVVMHAGVLLDSYWKTKDN